MRRPFLSRLAQLVLAAGLLLCFAAPNLQAQTASQRDAAEEQGEFRWHLINSVIFAAGFAYAIWKYSPAFFNARSSEIQKAIQDATGLKIQADFRYSEMDRKMATLPREVARLREQSKAEMEREHRRRSDETEHELRTIHASLQAQIAASREEGVHQIQRTAALKALESAERQLQDRANTGGDGVMNEGLLTDFIHLVERGKN